MSTYCWIDLGAVLVPFLFTFHPRLRFHRHWKALGTGLLVMMLIFIPWDVLFTARGVWSFSADQVGCTRWLGLPLEEWAFFLCIPYACVFTYQALGNWRMKVPGPAATRTVGLVICIGALTLALLHPHRAYTVTTGIMLALWLAFLLVLFPAMWLGRFFMTYAVLLIPFLVVNGLLTGTGLDHPVVRYNDAENMGIRIGTIPVEDILYGMLMLLIVTTVYEAVEERAHRTTDR